MKSLTISFAGCLVVTALCAIADGKVFPDDAGMFPFAVSYDSPSNAVNVASFLDAPAGKHGFVRTDGERFVTDAGEIRFNGVNVVGPSACPCKADAVRVADRLARFGFNCVRLHFFDALSYGNFIQGTDHRTTVAVRPDTQLEFDADRVDRFDYFVTELWKRGIYVNLNLHVGRELDARDGFPEKMPWAEKGVDHFVPGLVALQRDFAWRLLRHVNPYSGKRYLDSPGVAVVEINNENGLFWAFQHTMETWPAYYADLLKIRWNHWLGRHEPGNADAKAGRVELVRFSDRGKADPVLWRRFHEFLFSIEERYWTEMHAFLKDLGVRVPIAGTQLRFSPPQVQAKLDYVDHHAYWCHLVQYGAETWKSLNLAMVNDPIGGRLAEAAGERVAGKPFVMSEYNHPYPNFYGAEGQLLVHAYGAFHGWSGITAHSWNNSEDEEPFGMPYFFPMTSRSEVLVHFPACAAMFLRGDVTRGADRLNVPLDFRTYLDRLVSCRALRLVSLKTEGGVDMGAAVADPKRVGQLDAYRCPLAVALDGAPVAVARQATPPGATVVSSTGELLWNQDIPGAGYASANAPNVKYFTGFPSGRRIPLGDMTLEVGPTKLGWTTVSLTSLDATGFGADGRSARVLLAATGWAHNTGAKFRDEEENFISCRADDWGRGPYLCEGVPLTLTFPVSASRLRGWALDERGNRREALEVRPADGKAVLSVGPANRTLWYELEVKGNHLYGAGNRPYGAADREDGARDRDKAGETLPERLL